MKIACITINHFLEWIKIYSWFILVVLNLIFELAIFLILDELMTSQVWWAFKDEILITAVVN